MVILVSFEVVPHKILWVMSGSRIVGYVLCKGGK